MPMWHTRQQNDGGYVVSYENQTEGNWVHLRAFTYLPDTEACVFLRDIMIWLLKIHSMVERETLQLMFLTGIRRTLMDPEIMLFTGRTTNSEILDQMKALFKICCRNFKSLRFW